MVQREHWRHFESACNRTAGAKEATEYIFWNSYSLVTDGAFVNTGAKSGLWSLSKTKMPSGSDNDVPLLKILCCVHEYNLAWKSVNEIAHIFQQLVGISTLFFTHPPIGL